MSNLTDKQKLFCKEYIIDLNATQAAIRAKYSKKTAQQIGSSNLLKVVIQEEISRLNKKRFDKVDKDGEKVIAELAKIGFSDIKDYLDIEEGGAITAKSIEEMKNTGVIQSIKEKKRILETPGDGDNMVVDSTFEIKLWDKVKSLELLGKHLKLFTDKIEVDASDTLAGLLQKSRERMDKSES